MQPTYFMQHPDGSFTAADPQPNLNDYLTAAELVADIYEAVTHNTGDPKRGVLEDVQDRIAELEKENDELSQNVCSECSPDNYGWIFNRVEGKAACGCMTEAEPFQILTAALEKLACLGNGDRFGNSDGNIIAIEALRAVLPLDYSGESFRA